jgi:hypothetical protein
MHIRRHMLAWILALPLIPAGAQPIPPFLEPILANGRPRTVAQVLLLTRKLAESGACARAEFYSAPVMRALFGEGSDAKVNESPYTIVASSHGLQELVTADDESTRQSPYLKGVWLDVRRPTGESQFRAACFLSVTFWGEMAGLDHPSIKALLGEGERDTKAERDRDVMIGVHPWGRPPTVYKDDVMGEAIINYRAGAGSLTLNFDLHGKLHEVFVSWPNGMAVPNTPP